MPTEEFSFPADAWIDGGWQAGPERLAVTDPSTGGQLVQVRLCEAAAIQTAVDSCHRAMQSWKHTSASQRADVLSAVACRLEAEQQSLAQTITREQGKPLPQAVGEVQYAVSFFRWFAEQVQRREGRIVSHPDPEREYRLQPTPLGVAGLVTPWNFPLALGAKKIATALAAGCGAVWKPSELTPLSALRLGPILAECGVPDGLIQIVPALGPVCGDVFTNHPDIRVISLTGSVRTGRQVMRAAASQLQKVSLELGGNAPFIVLPDADLEQTAGDLLQLKLFVSGQVCVSANRVFVGESQEQEFLDCLSRRLAEVRVGRGLEPGVQAGPLIHQQACDQVRQKVEAACATGAEIVAENTTSSSDPLAEGGSWFPPTLLRGVTDPMAVACEELFGPVISVLNYRDPQEAVQRANATHYGLAGYVYGQDPRLLRSVAEQLEVGIVGVNEWRPLRPQVPFGGVKHSGIGAEGGTDGLEEFQYWKVLSLPR